MKTEWPRPVLGTASGHEDQTSYNPIYMYLGFPPAISIPITTAIYQLLFYYKTTTGQTFYSQLQLKTYHTYN